MPVKEELRDLNHMIQNMNSQLELLDELVNTNVTTVYDLDIAMKAVINSLSESAINDMTEDDMYTYLAKGFAGEGDNTNITNLQKLHQDAEEYKDKEFIEYVRYVFLEIKKELNEYAEMQNEKEKLLKSATDITDNYFNYVNSAEYRQKQQEKVDSLRKQIDSETDPRKRREIEEMLVAIENTYSLDFLLERLNNPKLNEANNIKNVFFDSKRSSMVMDKFIAKLPRFGYNADIYKMFFNIEEKFLPEEYHDLNNIFLFHVMRYISYTDSYNKIESLYVSTILIRLYNLLYHRYPSNEMEQEFIDFIKKIDDYFMPYIEYFKTYNVTSPNHPRRIQRDEEYEQKRRMMIIASLENAGITPDTTLSTEELRSQLQEVIDKKEKEPVIDDGESVEEALDKLEKESDQTIENESESIPTMPINSSQDVEKMIEKVESTMESKELDSLEEEISRELVITNEQGEVIHSSAPVVEVKDNNVENVKESKEDNVLKENELNTKDDDMVVPVVTANKKQPTEIEVYKDVHGNYYVENGGTYGYCTADSEVLEENISQETVLRLISVGALEKTTILV